MVPTNLPCIWGRVKQAELTKGRVDPDSLSYTDHQSHVRNSLVDKESYRHNRRAYTSDVDSGYPHDGRANKNPYPHDRRADKDSYPHDSNNQSIILRLQLSIMMINVQLMLV